MNRRDRKATVAKAKAEGMNRRDRKALGRKLKTDNLTTRATEEPDSLLQRKRDLVTGRKNFEASESAAGLKAVPYRKWRPKAEDRFGEYVADKYRRA